MEIWVATIIMTSLIISYYSFGIRLLRPISYSVAQRTLAFVSIPYVDWMGLWKLLGAIVFQALFAILLLLILDVEYLSLIQTFPGISDLVYGVSLGLGLLGTSSMLCFIVLKLAMNLFPVADLSEKEDWSLLVQGGWMAEFKSSCRVVGRWGTLFLALLYITTEELIFRGIIVTVAGSLGVLVAVALSSILFTLAQLTVVTGWRSSLFPVTASLVVGPVHAWLYANGFAFSILLTSHVVLFSIPLFSDYTKPVMN
ncbi:MAG: CPBP family intramembrane metalloprotease [Nitrospina sp.]|nr:CPBP family intramembrane metalloprotease [Nitrospina sp.]MBT6717835.1 CPBP family intramembrane metalloprotease [Nitrospina sp.]